jgi:hypothetical protein
LLTRGADRDHRFPGTCLMFFRLLAMLFLFLTVSASAQQWEWVIGGVANPCLTTLPCGTSKLEWHPNGPSENGAATLELAPAGAGVVYGLGTSGTQLFDVRRNQADRLIFSASGQTAHALVVSASGTTYVTTSSVGFVNRVLAIGANGTLLATYVLPFPATAAIDLASDQCTLFYSDADGVIHRFNVCTGTSLPDFASGPALLDDLHILPDGGVIVSMDDVITTFAPNGSVVRTYTIPNLGDGGIIGDSAVVLERAGTVLVTLGWEGEGLVYRLDLTTGSFTPLTPGTINSPRAIVALDGWTAALGPLLSAVSPGVPVPATSTFALFTLAAVLVLVAIRRLV